MNAFNKNSYVVFLLIFQKLMKTATMRVQFIIFLNYTCLYDPYAPLFHGPCRFVAGWKDSEGQGRGRGGFRGGSRGGFRGGFRDGWFLE